MNRRHFIVGSAAAVTAFKSVQSSPSDTVRVACVGVRGQGQSHMRAYAEMPNVELAALCDVDESVLEQRLKDAEALTGRRPAAFTDVRKLLEDKSIDAICIATPNHSHALQAIWGCQAGKGVYVEKPCAHNIFEARQLLAAAKKYNRMVQHGTNARSSPVMQEAVQKVQDGVIGEVYMSRGLCYKWRDAIGHTPVESVPPGVHYDLWLGPAPEHAFTRNRFHYNFHWFWEYGNAILGIRAFTKWMPLDGFSASSTLRRSPQSAGTSCSMTIKRRPTRWSRLSSSTSLHGKCSCLKCAIGLRIVRLICCPSQTRCRVALPVRTPLLATSFMVRKGI